MENGTTESKLAVCIPEGQVQDRTLDESLCGTNKEPEYENSSVGVSLKMAIYFPLLAEGPTYY